MLGKIIFGPDANFELHESQGALPEVIRLERQVSYFADQDGFDGLLIHIEDDQVGCHILPMLWEDRAADYHPYRPFKDWRDVEDDGFRNVVLQMMNLDPMKRITARQALDHPWFQSIDVEQVA